jgi:hypothetical protein
MKSKTVWWAASFGSSPGAGSEYVFPSPAPGPGTQLNPERVTATEAVTLEAQVGGVMVSGPGHT